MKKIILLALILLATSCVSKEEKNDALVKEIIENSYYGIDLSTKIKDIQKIKEDLLSLAVHYTHLEKFIDIDKNSEYKFSRHIYKTNKGVYRMFYIIDLTQKKIIKSSNDYNAFFRPLLIELSGKEPDKYLDFSGDRLMQTFRF